MENDKDGIGYGYLKGLIEGQERRISKIETALENNLKDVYHRLVSMEKLLSRWLGIGIGVGGLIGILLTVVTALISHDGWKVF